MEKLFPYPLSILEKKAVRDLSFETSSSDKPLSAQTYVIDSLYSSGILLGSEFSFSTIRVDVDVDVLLAGDRATTQSLGEARQRLTSLGSVGFEKSIPKPQWVEEAFRAYIHSPARAHRAARKTVGYFKPVLTPEGTLFQCYWHTLAPTEMLALYRDDLGQLAGYIAEDPRIFMGLLSLYDNLNGDPS